MIQHEACLWLGTWCAPAKTFYKLSIATAIRPTEEWVGVGGAILVAAVLYALSGQSDRRLSLRAMSRFIAPRSIYTHASSIVDYKYFLSLIVVQPMLATALISVTVIPLASPIAPLLARVFGDSPGLEPTWISDAIYTVLLLVAGDFGYFIFHYLAHRNSVLWEFHKVHHAAEVLNPVTAYRNHPVDTIVQQVFMALMIAPVNGMM